MVNWSIIRPVNLYLLSLSLSLRISCAYYSKRGCGQPYKRCPTIIKSDLHPPVAFKCSKVTRRAFSSAQSCDKDNWHSTDKSTWSRGDDLSHHNTRLSCPKAPFPFLPGLRVQAQHTHCPESPFKQLQRALQDRNGFAGSYSWKTISSLTVHDIIPSMNNYCHHREQGTNHTELQSRCHGSCQFKSWVAIRTHLGWPQERLTNKWPSPMKLTSHKAGEMAWQECSLIASQSASSQQHL